MPSYDPAYQAGALARIKTATELEAFRDAWKLHNPLQPEQVAFAGQERRIASVGTYHGGDILYQLVGVPGVWHEVCLESA